HGIGRCHSLSRNLNRLHGSSKSGDFAQRRPSLTVFISSKLMESKAVDQDLFYFSIIFLPCSYYNFKKHETRYISLWCASRRCGVELWGNFSKRDFLRKE